ncbi:ribosome biogenesis factor YjgA [Variovorax dokdonensis]|uniref:Dual-action ribosomal maturation protein DarP n=1 Tax=Variovorax dokdonensis TaxID=344883 RepID=A0ABT7NET3_9BURK|nr:ribosome biogenesis factor YjgA [Variovorax dokdonensis]MDM0046457.1 ribosome biogenesis factor YjgA [Variovorax dokdonensis]
MPRKPKKGYFVRGQFVAEGSELDVELKRELKGQETSKTDLKRESARLQALGEALLDLRGAPFEQLELDDRLTTAVEDARRITNFEGKRRQMQFIGKLMRLQPAEVIDAIEAALAEQDRPSAEATAALHEAERWRERLIADDDAIGGWIEIHPATDAQQLRALVRQARKDLKSGAPGEAPRQGRAYRELFQLVRNELAAHGAEDAGEVAEEESRQRDA